MRYSESRGSSALKVRCKNQGNQLYSRRNGPGKAVYLDGKQRERRPFMLRVGVVGYGYWGPNLVRNLAACASTHPVAICDRDPRRLAKARQTFPAIHTSAEL